MFRVRLEKVPEGKEEVIIRYAQMTPEITALAEELEGRKRRLLGRENGKEHLLDLGMIYYFESVDDKVFAYTFDHEYQVSQTLTELEKLPGSHSFFRCSKSLIVNIMKITSLGRMVGGRIDAVLDNGEHVVISRHYAGAFYATLKGGTYENI